MNTFNRKQEVNNQKHKSIKKKFAGSFLIKLQSLGKSLMYPIALLPFAAFLNRFGSLAMELNSQTVHNVGWWIGFIIQKPGLVIFDNLPLLFAIGIAFGLAKDQRGEAALIGAGFYLILTGLLGRNCLPKLFYDDVITFDFYKTGNNGPELAGSLSSLFYVPKYGEIKNKLEIIGGTYILNIGVLGGIVSGCLSAWAYNKFKSVKLPQALSFFGGRRFAPIVAMVLSIPIAFMFAIIWPWFQYSLINFGKLVSSGDSWAIPIPGAFLYALLNRLVQPTGLHHIINTFLWFQMPINGFIVDFNGKVVLFNNMYENPLLKSSTILSSTGLDVMNQISNSIFGQVSITNQNFNQYFSIQMCAIPNNVILTTTNNVPCFTIFGDINAFQKSMVSGNFQTGYFPMFWGGLPGAALAMIYSAKKENRKEVISFLAGVAIVAALTGIDEPLVFSFIFVGPILLVINALYTAIFASIAIAMHMHIGFGFSGGFIDYAISFSNSWAMSKYERIINGPIYGILSNPLWMFVLAGLAFPTYFFTFNILIKKMNILTPGREEEMEIKDNK
ncbi:PTS transporter subunit EIIC [Spiroplasma floricola]|uniref:PTS transporter subunit EIIC n=1 Tax=Spiroplasma floricola TaxID=216937 RepID=UPI000C2D29FA|nr:PTS transporter subunit EIIC [Spiroplasma floricola]